MRHAGEVYGGSRGLRPGTKHFYRRVFSVSRWEEFMRLHHRGITLQVCTGGSRFGTVRVDVDAAVPGVTVVADMRHLPFRAGSFQTVAVDPMYNLAYPERIHLQREAARVARDRIIFKAPWIPRASGWALIETTLLASHTCANVAVLSVLERRAGNETLDYHREHRVV